MKKPVTLSLLSLFRTLIAEGVAPNYVHVGTNLKCAEHAHNGRMFKNVETYSVEECYSRCYGLQGCNFFTFWESSDMCIGCSIADASELVTDNGFEAYQIVSPQTPSQFGYSIWEGTGGASGIGMKCPYVMPDGSQHEDRIIKYQVTTKDECFQACLDHPECCWFSWGEDEVGSPAWEGNCMLCREDDEIENHAGFNFWTILPELKTCSGCQADGRSDDDQSNSDCSCDDDPSSTSDSTSDSASNDSSDGDSSFCVSGAFVSGVETCPAGIKTGYYPDLTNKNAYCYCTGTAAPSRYEACSGDLHWDSTHAYLNQDCGGVHCGSGGYWGTQGGVCNWPNSVSAQTQERPPYTRRARKLSGSASGSGCSCADPSSTSDSTSDSASNDSSDGDSSFCVSGAFVSGVETCPAGIKTGYYPDLTNKNAYCYCTGTAAPSRYEACSGDLHWDSTHAYLNQDCGGVHCGSGGYWGTQGGVCNWPNSVSARTQERPPYTRRKLQGCSTPPETLGDPAGGAAAPLAPPGTHSPTFAPAVAPTHPPTASPTPAPTATPTASPTPAPTPIPGYISVAFLKINELADQGLSRHRE